MGCPLKARDSQQIHNYEVKFLSWLTMGYGIDIRVSHTQWVNECELKRHPLLYLERSLDKKIVRPIGIQITKLLITHASNEYMITR